MHKFWRLHSRVYESLREQNVPVGRLVAHLLSLRAFDPVYNDSQKPALQSFIKELRSAESIEDVLFIIRDYFSFFNYRVIEHIVEGLGTDRDRAELQNYERDFDEYSNQKVYECPPEYGSKSNADHADLVVKVDSVFDEFTVKELKKFQYRLGQIFCVHHKVFYISVKWRRGVCSSSSRFPHLCSRRYFHCPVSRKGTWQQRV